MKYSVITRCLNEARWLGYSIQSCEDLLDDPEIIFIDNESSDESKDVARMFEHHVNIKFVKIRNYSPGRALNVGVIESEHPNILILSAHCVLKKFDSQKHSLDLEKYVAVFGNQVPIYRGRRIMKRYVWSHFTDDGPVVDMTSKIENRPFLHNAMCVYRKDFLVDHPFDEILYGKEDRYWAKSVIEEGHHYLYDPSMLCEHHWTEGGATWKGIG